MPPEIELVYIVEKHNTSITINCRDARKRQKHTVRLREHFMFCNCKLKVAILQEGPEPLPGCDQCRMHMQAARLFKHQNEDKCHKSTERRIWRVYVEMAERCGEMEFKLDREEG